MTAAEPAARRLPGVYEGTVVHLRPGGPPEGGPAHRFSYDLSMVLLDVSRPGDLLDRHPLYSTRRPAVRQFRRADFFGDPAMPLDRAVRARVEAECGRDPGGPVLLLANLRTAGFQFNPLSCYYCFDESGEEVVAMLGEVTNTPWLERQAYVVGPPGTHLLDKALHVSPFFPMDQRYALTYDAPGERLGVRIDVTTAGELSLRATLALGRVGAGRRELSQALARHPGGPLGVTAGIYKEAWKLWRKGATVYRHPPKGARRRAAAATGERER